MRSLTLVARRLKLWHYLFLLLLALGIGPLGLSSLYLTAKNRDVLETQERSHLTQSARALSVELNESFRRVRGELTVLADGLLAAPGPSSLEERLRQPWLARALDSFLSQREELVGLRVVGPDGAGPSLEPELPETLAVALADSFDEALASGRPAYRFVASGRGGDPSVSVAVPAPTGSPAPQLVAQGIVRLQLMELIFQREAQGEVAVFLIDRQGRLLWSEGADPALGATLARSELVRDFVRKPSILTHEFDVTVEGRDQRMLAQVSPVAETGWGVVVQKPSTAAFTNVQTMVFHTAVSTALLVALALVLAIVGARAMSGPIRRLEESSRRIAEGDFRQRVDVSGPGLEIIRLAGNFNRMSEHLEEYVERLEEAARTNRALFLGAIRAFAATIDAKDPYTRGHSERVATYSRAIAKHMGLALEFQDQVWVGALLHDVGKIGIDDRILKKGGVLSPQEYDQMKLHPVIGAEILSPIELLRDIIPAIRWHHEDWNGRGYPDGLKGERIPLIARIVGVADCFDAITKDRPYQRGYSASAAVDTIVRLAGSRFDAKVVTAFLSAHATGEIRLEPDAERRGEARAAAS